MTNDQLTAILAERIMGWRVGPDRILKGGRQWMPRWQFQPLQRMEQAAVTVHGVRGTVTEKSEPAALTRALALALGISVEETR